MIKLMFVKQTNSSRQGLVSMMDSFLNIKITTIKIALRIIKLLILENHLLSVNKIK